MLLAPSNDKLPNPAGGPLHAAGCTDERCLFLWGVALPETAVRAMVRVAATCGFLIAVLVSSPDAAAQQFVLVDEWDAQDPRLVWTSPANRIYVERPGETLEFNAASGALLTRFSISGDALVALRNGDVLIEAGNRINRYRSGASASVGVFASGFYDIVDMFEAPDGSIFVLTRNNAVTRRNADGTAAQTILRNTDHSAVEFLAMQFDASTQTMIVGDGSRMIRTTLAGQKIADLDFGDCCDFAIAPDGTLITYGSFKGSRIFRPGQTRGQPFATSAFGALSEVAFNRYGTLYVTDFFANKVRVYATDLESEISPDSVFHDGFE